jgi:predicted nucleic acid-binding protein
VAGPVAALILVDTSVWVDHLRRGNTRLKALLLDTKVITHPFVAGELALGHLERRAQILALLANLPQACVASHEQVMRFVDDHALFGSGLGWVDAHLLCAAAVQRLGLWSLDRPLAVSASRFGLKA